jgi:hypothetical protein
MRDLLTVAPLVSKAWQAITLSPALQRALFFEPDLTGTQPVENPLLVELFPPFFLLPSGDWPPPWSWPGNASRFKEMSWVTAPDAFKREDVSWRRMLVTQPPTRTMVVTHMTHSMIGDFEQRAVLKDLSLRMGVLYDIAMPFVDGGAAWRVVLLTPVSRSRSGERPLPRSLGVSVVPGQARTTSWGAVC